MKPKAGTITNSETTLLHDGLHWDERAEWNFKVLEIVKYRGEGKKWGQRKELFCYKRPPRNCCIHTLPSPSLRAAFSWSSHGLSSISVVTDLRLFVHHQMAHAMCQIIIFFLVSIKTNLSPPKRHPAPAAPLLWCTLCSNPTGDNKRTEGGKTPSFLIKIICIM